MHVVVDGSFCSLNAAPIAPSIRLDAAIGIGDCDGGGHGRIIGKSAATRTGVTCIGEFAIDGNLLNS